MKEWFDAAKKPVLRSAVWSNKSRLRPSRYQARKCNVTDKTLKNTVICSILRESSCFATGMATGTSGPLLGKQAAARSFTKSKGGLPHCCERPPLFLSKTLSGRSALTSPRSSTTAGLSSPIRPPTTGSHRATRRTPFFSKKTGQLRYSFFKVKRPSEAVTLRT